MPKTSLIIFKKFSAIFWQKLFWFFAPLTFIGIVYPLIANQLVDKINSTVFCLSFIFIVFATIVGFVLIFTKIFYEKEETLTKELYSLQENKYKKDLKQKYDAIFVDDVLDFDDQYFEIMLNDKKKYNAKITYKDNGKEMVVSSVSRVIKLKDASNKIEEDFDVIESLNNTD